MDEIDRLLSSPALSDSTRRAYRADLERFTGWLRTRGLGLEDVDVVVLSDYVAELGRQRPKLAAATIGKKLTAVRALLRSALGPSRVPDASLARGMHRLVGGYSKRFNARHVRTGYLVRDRYWSRRKDTPSALLEAFRYVARNPVAAGLADRPEDWRWSSYATVVGISDTFRFVDATDVLGEFGATRRAQVRGLRRFVDAG